jgi:hypothetical protein
MWENGRRCRKNAGTCGTMGDMWENGWRNHRNMSEKDGKMTKSVAITVVPWSMVVKWRYGQIISDPIGKVFRCRGSAQPRSMENDQSLNG